MFERLQAAADKQADRMLMRVIRNLANRPAPPGVTIIPHADGVEFTGKGLKMRMMKDARFRNFSQ